MSISDYGMREETPNDPKLRDRGAGAAPAGEWKGGGGLPQVP